LNELIEGYTRNGCFFEALSAFKLMSVDENAAPNDATLVMCCLRVRD